MGLKSDLEALAVKVGQLEVTVASQAVTIADLERQLAECQEQPPPPPPDPDPEPPPPPPPPPPGDTPDIPPGTEVSPSELAAKVAAAPNGTVFRVKPGVASGVYLKLKPGQQVWGLDPTNMPVFKGADSPTNPTPFCTSAGTSSPDVTLAFLKVTGYHPADPGWQNVAGNDAGTMRRPAVDMDKLPNSRCFRLDVYENGLGLKPGDGSIIEQCHLHHNHQFGLKSNTERDWKILGGEWNHNNYKSHYNPNIGAATKFVSSTNGLIEDLFVHHQGGPGVWFDSGSNAVIIRRVRAEDNADAGFFWEINNGWCIIEDSWALRNAGAANIFISSSKGTASNPIIIRRNVTSGGPSGREIRLLGNGTRPPGLGYVSVLNNTTPQIRLALSNGHPEPVGIVVTGNKNAAGAAVGLTR